MEEKERGDKILFETLSAYKKNSIKVYIKKTNGRFYSGEILELAGDMVIIDDKILGALPIMFIEIDFMEAKRWVIHF